MQDMDSSITNQKRNLTDMQPKISRRIVARTKV